MAGSVVEIDEEGNCSLRVYGCITDHINWWPHHDKSCAVENIQAQPLGMCDCIFKELNEKISVHVAKHAPRYLYEPTIRDIAVLIKRKDKLCRL